MKIALLTAVSAIALLTSPAFAQDKPYSPYVAQNFPKNAYFGDTHVHTNIWPLDELNGWSMRL
jgi:hypothetical protein